MAWHIVNALPLGASSSRSFQGRDDSGREAFLREVPDGVTPRVSAGPTLGLVPLRAVTSIDGREYTVWDLEVAHSWRDVMAHLERAGRSVPLGVVARVVIDAARAVRRAVPSAPHGGLSDAALLLRRDGQTVVMDFGAPRSSRFTARGTPGSSHDVFSLGAVLHASLTGFTGSYADAVDEGLSLPSPSQLNDDSTPVLDDVVNRAIARSPERRQQDLGQLVEELEVVLGEELASSAQVAAFLEDLQLPWPRRPDTDRVPRLGEGDEGPTGRHERFGAKETVDDLQPVPARPPSAAPSSDSRPRQPTAGPSPGIPPTTQPDAKGPSLADEPPDATQPRGVIPQVTVVRPSRAASQALLDVDTQPRARVRGMLETEGSDASAPAPRPSGVSKEKLDWAATQTRVPTPPFGVPTAEEDSPLNGDASAPASTSGTVPQLEPVPAAPVSAVSAADREPRQGTLRAVIAVLLVVVAVLFGAVVWKKLLGQHATEEPIIETITVAAEDSGTDSLEGLDAGAQQAGEPAASVVDAGAQLVTGAEGAVDADDGDEADAAEAEPDAGAIDGGVQKASSPKPVKRKRRR